MPNIVVVYQSKYGASEQYAKWIAESLACDIYEATKMTAKDLLRYDTIIYGGGLYAIGVNGIKLISKNIDQLADKTLVLFTCGLADPNDPVNTANIRQGLTKVFTPAMLERIKLFHLRGGMDYAKLSLVHRGMMGMMHAKIAKKDPDTLLEEDKELLRTYGKSVDFKDKATSQPLVDYVKSIK